MRDENVPRLGARYWVAISIASLCGANLGDDVSHMLHLGHWRGLPPLALLFVALLLGERRRGWASMAWYWGAILVARTAATNLADLATHDFHLPYAWVIAVLETLLVLLLIPAATRPFGRQATDGWYWAAMLTAGTLGTAIGDCVAGDFGLGTGWGTVVLGAVLLVVLMIGAPSGWVGKPAYWIGIVAVRSAGTTAGDFTAGRHGLNLGLSISTLASAILLVAVLRGWHQNRKTPA